ncbi:MAG TPA: PrgI family protein [Candidatus Saccharimonadales bacterium]|nr:PrgI family protein [Candidatus Saccharimonadales bacterium]
MATYKVLQDIEAEDKLIGPLTLRQCIYAAIAALSLYLGFLATTKHAAFMLAIFVPIAATTSFFAFPWGRDQPTEVWALAKIRFLIKPRKRIWDQSGMQELVTVTAPKIIQHALTNGLSQEEVRSRLSALATTVDSRGWAIKNVQANLNAFGSPASDRLVQGSVLPQQVAGIDIPEADDMLNESASPVAQHFQSMMNASAAAHRQQLMAQMQQPATPPMQPAQAAQPQQQPADFWFMHPTATVPGQATFVDTPVIVPGAQPAAPAIPQAATPTAEEEALLQKLHHTEQVSTTAAYGHMKTLKTPAQIAEEEAAARRAAADAAAQAAAAAAAAKPQVTPEAQAVILDLSNNDDLDVATIARQAHKATGGDDGEVVISLR